MNGAETTILACPECRGTRFSWVLHQVQFGTVHSHGDGQFSEEGHKMGPVTGSDIGENGLFCVECCEDRSYDELVLVDEGTA